MEATELAKIVYDRWTSSLKERDRRRDQVQGNFDELFSELKALNLSFKEAHVYLAPAIKAHMPNNAVKKNTWKKLSTLMKNVTESEFYKDWEDLIKSKGTESFFSFFPLNIKNDEDDEPKVYGNMSSKEYSLQRKHADSFPRVDLNKLRQQQLNQNFEEINLDDVLGDK